MRRIMDEKSLRHEVSEGKREARCVWQDEMYLEKLIERARHVSTDRRRRPATSSTCSSATAVQRRNQKVVERAPARI